MKPIYEIVRIEEDKIFIIPHKFDQTENTLGRVSNQIENYCNHINCFNKKIIFGFIKFSFSKALEYEWKVVKGARGGPAGMGARSIYFFEKYEGEFPDESEITGFPSSVLLDS